MALSLLLGRVMALYFIIIGLSVLVNRDDYKKFLKELKKNRLVLFYGGVFEVIFALFIVVGHNVWTNDWRAIVTLMGWAMLIEGGLVLFLPEQSIKLAQIWRRPSFVYVSGLVSILIGMYLAYVTFV
jgi:uncharacterized membrane protein